MIYTITYPARCKDCKFIESYYKGKRKLHKCVFENRNTSVTLRDLVCNNWKLFGS